MTKEGFMKKYPEGMEFDVLGTTYTLHYDEEECTSQNCQGLCELYTKQIVISLKGFGEPSAFNKVEDYYKKVMRHELMHAFFYESGFTDYGSDETLVDALAVQMPKITKLMKGIM